MATAELCKSPNDTREYRIIKLPNGLTALLISDLASILSISSQDGDRPAEKPMSSSSLETSPGTPESMDINGSSSPFRVIPTGSGKGTQVHDVTDIIAPDFSLHPMIITFQKLNRTSESARKKNSPDDFDMRSEEEGGEDGGSSDPDDASGSSTSRSHKEPKHKEEKLAAAALCVGVGSFCDPDDIPGFAHFLEHMVFMGSEKFPDENSFDTFIKQHGGSDNASTDTERTVFQFEVDQYHFKEALLRFAQFFVAPLLKASSTDRELEAVDSEFQMSLPTDHFRKQQLLGNMCKRRHPMGKFMWGNSCTLKSEPARKGIDVHHRLVEFRKNMYSAHYMTLAVQSRETLDTLEEWVKQSFSDIPNNGLDRPSFAQLGQPFDMNKYHKLYKVIPVKETHTLEINWSFPCLLKGYGTKPLYYLSWLLGHEGHGSILALLKKKALALSLFSGNCETGFEHNETYAAFMISVTLTDHGMDNVEEVIAIIFQYIKMLQKLGPQQRIFEEIKTIDDIDFRFQEELPPQDHVVTVSENMQLYPPEHYLNGHLLEFEYDEKLIANCTNQIQAETANFMLLSKRHQGKTTCVEPWYQTQYSVEDVPKRWIDRIQNLEENPDLHLPEPNKFIAKDFKLKCPDREDTDYPVCILDTPHSKLWYKRDNKFHAPRGYIIFQLITPLVNKSAKNLVLFDFLATILEHNLTEIGYEADTAQLEYTLKTEESGLVMKMNGFNDKLPLLFETIISYLSNFSVSEEMFQAVKESIGRSYYNHIIKPNKLNNDVRLGILQQYKWIPVEKRSMVSQVTRREVLAFANTFKETLFIEGLVQGNFTSEEALGFEESLRTKLNCKPLPKDMFPTTRVVELPIGYHVCKVKGFNIDDTNTVVTNYYQAGPGTIRKLSIIDVLVMMMEEPCFDVLRTKEQLGYSVHATCRNSFGIIGFSVTVTTQATKFSAAHVDQRIDAFLEAFYHEKLCSLTEENFQGQVEALVNLKLCADVHLGEEVDRIWSEVLHHTYVFDRLIREVDALRSLSFNEVKDFLISHIRDGRNFRKLSAQVIGNGKHEMQIPHPVGSEADAENDLLQGLVHLSLDEASGGQSVASIRRFKNGLTVYPVTKIDS